MTAVQSSDAGPRRLTQYAAGGGCACKIPVGRLERIVSGLRGGRSVDDETLVVGVEDGDDAAAVRVEEADGVALISTADFFTPVVDDPYDWGRIAAVNALSDVYAMGGRPVLAINLVAWPLADPDDPAGLPDEMLARVLEGGADVGRQAGCPVAGGHSVTAPEPLYGLSVTGVGDPDRLLRNDAAAPGQPLSLTKPIGSGVLNNRHKSTGERFEQAIDVMTTLNAEASAAALAAGVRAATDVTGFGLLGHLYKMLRASGVGAVIDTDSVPVIEGVRESMAAGYLPGGSRRNLDWVRPHVDSDRDENTLVLLADAQTSGGLLVVGEIPGAPVIGHTTAGPARITVR